MPSRNVQPKQPGARAMRILRDRKPKVKEDAKKTLVLRGRRASDVVLTALKDLYRIKAPDAKMFSRKNDLNPMEDATSIEFLMGKNDASLFAFGSHNKKRPHNLVLGRTFDGHMLDMVELGLLNLRGVDEMKGLAKRVGSKPAMMFAGELWEQDPVFRKLQNLLVDFFRGEVVDKVALAGLDHCMVCTAVPASGPSSAPQNTSGSGQGQGGKVLLRHYHMGFKRSGSKVPNVLLSPVGPSMDLVVRRSSLASPDLWKSAIKQPKQLTAKKRKNMSTNQFGDTLGRVHLGRQDLSSMQVRRVKALREPSRTGKRPRKEADGDGDGDGES